MRHTHAYRWLWPVVVLATLALPACRQMRLANPKVDQPVPAPIDLLLPKEISIHPFTGMRAFDDAGGVKGIDVRIEAKDSYGDTTRAYGDYRFELYTFRPNSTDPKDARIAAWDVALADPLANRIHWDHITRTYKFRLQWDQPIPVGQRFVLSVIFSSPFTQRLFAERVFISGQ